MNVTYASCVADDDFAKASLFMLERKYDLHPSFTTLQMVALIYGYITQGTIFRGELPDGRTISIAAYYQGTPERDFVDKDVVLIDVAILDRPYRGTRSFLHGLDQLIESIRCRHPEVQEVRFSARSANEYLYKLYSKFATFAYSRDGDSGEESVFSANITHLGDMLARYRRV
ncbi:hypothetical protein MO973_01245 [Paenibacillus sp. TRM 82003]|nr:hypothetical protein [Paenibacillus sp. TRM 82003]